MKEIKINGTTREQLGKKASNLARKAGLVPCVMYGEERNEQGLPVAVAFTVKYEEIRKLLYTPEIFLVDLVIDGKKHTAILQDAQFHPVKDEVLHVDFYEVNADKPIVMAVPIATTGLAAGVKAGGRLNVPVRRLKARATFDKIPEKLYIDVTNLALGKSIKVADLSFEGLELVTSKDVVVCTVKMTRNSRSAEDSAAADAESTEETPAE